MSNHPHRPYRRPNLAATRPTRAYRLPAWLAANPPATLSGIALTDQIEAAAAESRRGAHYLATAIGGTRIEAVDTRGRVGDRVDTWIAGPRLAACEHLDQPQPIAGILADPGWVYCLTCFTAAVIAQLVSNPDRCDTCRQPDPDLYGQLFVTHGHITLYAEICWPCHDTLDGPFAPGPDLANIELEDQTDQQADQQLGGPAA